MGRAIAFLFFAGGATWLALTIVGHFK
jgi:hypothetical protein